MKQTIRTKNYDAVLEIPYEKLQSKCNFYKVPQKDNCQCSNRIIMTGSCCCKCEETSASKVDIEVLEELQNAYDLDMAEKDKEISVLKMEVDQKNQRNQEQSSQINKLEGILKEKTQRNQLQVKKLREESETVQEELRLSKIQRQKIIKSKISEFQNKLMKQLLQQEQKINRVRQQLQRQFQHREKQLLHKIEELNIKLNQKDSEISAATNLNAELREKLRDANFQNNSSQSKIRELELSLVNLQNQSASHLERNGDLANTISGLKSEINSLHVNFGVQQQMNHNLSSTVSTLQAEKAKAQHKINSLEHQLKSSDQLKHQYKIEWEVLKQKLERYQIQIKEKDRLVRQVDNLEMQIQLLRKTFTQNGVVDERIQRVQQQAEDSFRQSESKIKEECQLHKSQIQELSRKNYQLQQLVKKITEENENFLLNIADVDSKNKQLETLVCHWKCKYLGLQKQFTQILSERTTLLKGRQESERRIESIISKVTLYEQDKAITAGRLSSYEREIKNLNTQIYELREELRKLHITLAQKQKLLAERQACSHEVNIQCQKYIGILERQVEERSSLNQHTSKNANNSRQQRSRSYSPHQIPIIEHQQGMTSEHLQNQLGEFYKKQFPNTTTFDKQQ